MKELADLLDMVLAPELTSAGEPVEGAAWARLVEAQLTRVGLSEDLGGVGGTLEDAYMIVARCGEAALSVPIVEALVAGTTASRSGLALPDGLVTMAIPAPSDMLDVTCTDDGWRLSGTISEVAWGAQAKQILIAAPAPGDRSVVLETGPGDYVTADGTNLAGEPRATLSFDTLLPGAVVHTAEPDLFDTVQLLACFGRTCQIAGAARRATQMTIEYAQLRRQFGQRIGDQQIVAHTIAEMMAETAALDAAVAAGIPALAQAADADGGARHASASVARFAASVARVQAGRAAGIVARHAHQVHAAIGIAAEHPLHQLTLRLWAWPYEYGTPHTAAIDLANMLLERRSLWKLLTNPAGDNEGGGQAPASLGDD